VLKETLEKDKIYQIRTTTVQEYVSNVTNTTE